MTRIAPVCWKILECIFLKAGFILERHHTSSHRIYSKPGVARPIVIPTYPEIDIAIISGLMRTAGMNRDTYFAYLSECQ